MIDHCSILELRLNQSTLELSQYHFAVRAVEAGIGNLSCLNSLFFVRKGLLTGNVRLLALAKRVVCVGVFALSIVCVEYLSGLLASGFLDRASCGLGEFLSLRSFSQVQMVVVLDEAIVP